MLARIIISLLFLINFFYFATPVIAQTQNSSEAQPLETKVLEAEVTKVVEEKTWQVVNKTFPYQILELKLLTGDKAGQAVTVDTRETPLSSRPQFKVGEKVVVNQIRNFEGKFVYFITDYIRRDSLYWLFGAFLLLSLLIGRKKAISSLLGMGLTFLVIFWLILPKISSGVDPVLVVILASLFIIPITFYLSHGFNKKNYRFGLGDYGGTNNYWAFGQFFH